MKSFNTYYISREMFVEFAYENDLDTAKNVLVQIFSSKLDKETINEITKVIYHTIPNASLIGATTDGEIYDENVTTNEVVISCSIFDKSSVKSDFVYKDDLTDYDMGVKIAQKLASKNTKLLILFADGIHTNGEDFLNGVHSIAPDIMIAGGLAGDGGTFVGTKVFSQDKIIDNGAVGVAIDSDVLKVYNNYHFGWQRIGPVMEVTKSDKNIVYEINNKSAYDIYKYYLGENAAKKLPAIGIEFPLIKEKDGVDIARAVLSKNDDNSLTFAGNIEVGAKVQLGFGNIHEILKTSSRDNILVSKNIESIFIYSCMARRRFLQNDISLELQIFTNRNISISGFFTYGEFFKNKNSCELLNQTMTTISLSEKNICEDDNSINDYFINPLSEYEAKSDTMIALSHLVNVTSKESEKANSKLQDNVNKKTIELQEKVLELQKATKAKSDFLANMSHEIRTPLNAITGFIDILLEKEEDIKNKNYLDIVKSSSDSLLTIINDILDFSKIESGNLNIEYIDFNLKDIVNNIGLLFFEKAKEKNIKLNVFFDDELPHMIKGDPTRLKQVFVNLIGNAIKFTEDGGKVIFSVEKNQNQKLFFKIVDNGVGIDEDSLKNIFKPFSQADGTTTRKYGGTGLGLTISSDLVKLMGSELKAYSKKNEGSTFYFEMPIYASTSNNIKKIEKDVIVQTFDGYTALLVEDNKANQMFMKVVLKKLKLNFEIANDGVEAVDMFKKNIYDIVLMDENMPNMNGMEATRIILEYEQKNHIKHTPIVALTANALKGDEERFLSAGMDEYLTKPLNREKLLNILSNYLQ